MIPLARDSRTLYIWKFQPKDTNGDVTADYKLCKKPVTATVYNVASNVEYLIEGQAVHKIVNILIANDGTRSIDVRDMLGSKTERQYKILDVASTPLSIRIMGEEL